LNRRKFLGTLALAPVAPWVAKLPFIGKWFEPPCEHEHWYYHTIYDENGAPKTWFCCHDCGLREKSLYTVHYKLNLKVVLPPGTSMRMRYIDNAKTLS